MLTQIGVQEPGTPTIRHAYDAAVLAACLVRLDEPWRTNFLLYCGEKLGAPWGGDGSCGLGEREVASWLSGDGRVKRHLVSLLRRWGALR